jgi:hypothetical protein
VWRDRRWMAGGGHEPWCGSEGREGWARKLAWWVGETVASWNKYVVGACEEIEGREDG